MKIALKVPFLTLSLCAVAFALSACSTAPKNTGQTVFGQSQKAPVANQGVLAELGNGLLGSSINRLAPADRTKALEAEYRALEYSPAGKSVSWRAASASASGEVVAAQPYQVGSQNCRQYTHSFSIDGAPQTVRGTACRNADGSWTPLT